MCLAVPGQILNIVDNDDLLRPARVDFGGVVREISLAYTPEAEPGDYVLAHVGFALSMIDKTRAQETLESLRAIVALDFGDSQ